jgi:hypothetical protein
MNKKPKKNEVLNPPKVILEKMKEWNKDKKKVIDAFQKFRDKYDRGIGGINIRNIDGWIDIDIIANGRLFHVKK